MIFIKKYLMSLRMRRTNVPQIAVLNERAACTFLCPVKLMLRISNFFPRLVEITLYQK